MHPLDIATTLQPSQPLVRADGGAIWLTGVTNDAYWNFAGPFGGYTAALLMRAVMEDTRRLGPPVAQTVNYCGAMTKGTFSIGVRLTRSGKATQHWSLELHQDGAVAATASIVCANRRETFAHATTRCPNAPNAYDVPPLTSDGRLPWLARYDFRFIEGGPNFGATPKTSTDVGGSRTQLWLKDAPDRPLDYVSISALCDCFILRLIQMRGTMVPMSTVSMTSYFHALPDELARHGTAHLLGIADAKRFEANFHDQSVELWSADGKLLASGMQTVWYKE
jgi:acyl-CoA thioesterase